MEATLIWTPNNPPSHHSRPVLTAWPQGDAGTLHRGLCCLFANPQKLQVGIMCVAASSMGGQGPARDVRRAPARGCSRPEPTFGSRPAQHHADCVPSMRPLRHSQAAMQLLSKVAPQTKQPRCVPGLPLFGLPSLRMTTLFRSSCIRTRSCTTSHLLHGVAAGSAPRSAHTCTAQDLPQPPWLHLHQI